jgi:hypothetical protein
MPAVDFIRSPLGIAMLMLASSLGGSWIKDRLSTETRDTGSSVRIESLEKRLDQLQADAQDNRRGALTAAAFNEFRLANDKRLDGVAQDVRDLLAQVNAEARLARVNKR